MSQIPTFSPPPSGYQQQPRPAGISTLKIVLIILGVCGVLAVCAVGAIVYFVSQTMTDSDVMKTIVATDQISELDVPKNWNKAPARDQNPDASLQHCNLFGETYAMVITESKTELANATGVSEGNYSLDDFTRLMTDYMTSTNFKAQPPMPVTVNGMPGQRVRMTTEYEGIPIAYLVTFVEGDRHFHQVHCWTLTSREAKNMPTLMKVAESFRER